MELWILNGLRIGIGLAFLSYAAYTDLKTRTVQNWVSILMALIGLIILGVQMASGLGPSIWYLIFIPAFCLLMYVMFQLRLFGGGDAKILMALSVLLPGLASLNSFVTPWVATVFYFGLLSCIPVCIWRLLKKGFSLSALKFDVPFMVPLLGGFIISCFVGDFMVLFFVR